MYSTSYLVRPNSSAPLDPELARTGSRAGLCEAASQSTDHVGGTRVQWAKHMAEHVRYHVGCETH